MCGITGLAFKSSFVNIPTYLRNSIQELFSDLLLSIENRGRSATGAAILKRDGSVVYAKAAIKASDFVLTDGYAELMTHMGDAISIIGHTRAPTHGPASNNKNNHPHMAGDTIGIHNGVISNHSELGRHWKLDTESICDSEIIFRLYDWAREKIGYTNEKALRLLYEQLEGNYACAFFTKREPNKLILFRGSGELETTLLEDKNQNKVFIFNSEASNIHKVVKEYTMFRSTPTNLTNGQVERYSFLVMDPTTWGFSFNSFKRSI